MKCERFRSVPDARVQARMPSVRCSLRKFKYLRSASATKEIVCTPETVEVEVNAIVRKEKVYLPGQPHKDGTLYCDPSLAYI